MFEHDTIQKLSKSDQKTPLQRLAKLMEEVGELSSVVLSLTQGGMNTHKFCGEEELTDELADIYLCLLSVGNGFGISEQDLEKKIVEKAQHWAKLQSLESGVDPSKIPFEIHVTVSDAWSAEKFQRDCASLGVKAVLLDLHTKSGGTLKDVMTSSTFVGGNLNALQEVARIRNGLKSLGYKVEREKVETVPWHPLAPTLAVPTSRMPPNCYFEAHVPIFCEESDVERYRDIVHDYGAHLSRNVLRRFDSGKVKVMATFRKHTLPRELFESALELLLQEFSAEGVSYSKPHVEFSIYDTKVSRDGEWVK